MNPPIQLVVQLHTEVSVDGHKFHLSVLDANWCRHRLDPPPKVHHHLLGLCDVEIKMVFVTPVHKVPDYTSILFVLASLNKTSDDREASSSVVFEVCCAGGIQEWGQDSPLWSLCCSGLYQRPRSAGIQTVAWRIDSPAP